MARYVLTSLFAIAVVGLYYIVDIRLFNLDLTRKTKEALFVLRNEPQVDQAVLLLNVGKLEPAELQEKIDSLLIAGPKRIGVNLCHLTRVPIELIAKYESDSRVVFTNCGGSGFGSLSQIVDDHNIVTHFKTDRPDYFELLLTDFKGRGNELERINYGPKFNFLMRGELTESYFWFNPEHLRNKIILIGYMGDHLTDSIYYYRNCRITPLNPYYGEPHILPDMYDIEITGSIVRMINDKDFINEVNQVIRVLIILAFSLLNVSFLTFVKFRWTIVNLIMATALFILLTGAGSFLLVYMFDLGTYLEMDELPLILLITTVFTVWMNIGEERSRKRPHE